MDQLPAMPVQDHHGSTLNFDHIVKGIESLEAQSTTATGLDKRVKAGAWTKVTLGAKVEENAEYQTVRCRTEQGGAVVRLRGNLKVKETLTEGEAICTLPEGFRPPGTVVFSAVDTHAGGTPTLLRITTAGKVEAVTVAMVAGVFIPFDGVTFNLT